MSETKLPKVLMFGWEFPPHNSGGLGVACAGLTRHLVRNGVELVFVLPKKISVSSESMKIIFAEKKAGTFFKYRSVETLLSGYITPTRYKEELIETLKRKEESIHGDTIYDEVLRYRDLSRAIAEKENYDIIHAHEWLSFPAAIETKRISNKPLVVHVHATEFDRAGGGNGNEKVHEIERDGMLKADGVIAVSNHTKETIVQGYGINPEKIDVVHNGVGEENISDDDNVGMRLQNLKANGTKIVLYVGRLTLQKGVDYFLQAAAQVLNFEKNVLFFISGSGDMEQQLMHQVAQLGISDKVLFAGWLKGAELTEAYRVADLFVMPSISEPFGLTPLEAMMNGTPALISKQSGVSETVYHALKTDFWDIDEMTDKILAVIGNDSLKCHLAQEGQEEVKKVNWHESAKKCMSIYNKLCFQT